MNLTENYPIILAASKALTYSYDYISNAGDNPYKVKGLKLLRQTITSLEHIEILEAEVKELRNSWIFQTSNDELLINSTNHNLRVVVDRLLIKLIVLKDLIESSGLVGNNDLLFVRLPDFKSFDELIKYGNDLKKALEFPLHYINQEANIIGADKGSVILYISVGNDKGIDLIAQLCWSAAVMRKKRLDSSNVIEQIESLDLEAGIIDQLIQAQKKQLKGILEAEASSIVNRQEVQDEGHETIRRFELAIETLASLIDKGGKILPMSTQPELIKSFPDYNALNLIESTIRQIESGDDL